MRATTTTGRFTRRRFCRTKAETPNRASTEDNLSVLMRQVPLEETFVTVTQKKRKNNPHQPVGRWIRVEKRLAIYLRDRFTCLYCGSDLHGVGDPRHIQLDHKQPKSKGGSNKETNVFTTCMHCNCSRGSKPFVRFASPGARLRVTKQLRLKLVPYLALAKSIVRGEITNKQALAELK